MEKLKFKIHISNLLKEIAENGLDRRMGILKIPINQLRERLIELAEIGREIDNPLLHLWLFDMALYEEAEPNSKYYNPKMRDLILKEIQSKQSDGFLLRQK